MGNKPTAMDYFEHLGIAPSSRNSFKDAVLDFCQQESTFCKKSRGNLSAASRSDLSVIAREYFHSGQYIESPFSARMSHTKPSETDITNLCELLIIWVDKGRKREYKDDRPYSGGSLCETGTTPKKRKIQSTPTSAQKSAKKAQRKKLSNADDSTGRKSCATLESWITAGVPERDRGQLLRSPTLTVGRGPVEDTTEPVDTMAIDADDLPPVSAIMSDRPQQPIEFVTDAHSDGPVSNTNRKGKAPVRNSPSQWLSESSTSTAVGRQASTNTEVTTPRRLGEQPNNFEASSRPDASVRFTEPSEHNFRQTPRRLDDIEDDDIFNHDFEHDTDRDYDYDDDNFAPGIESDHHSDVDIDFQTRPHPQPQPETTHPSPNTPTTAIATAQTRTKSTPHPLRPSSNNTTSPPPTPSNLAPTPTAQSNATARPLTTATAITPPPTNPPPAHQLYTLITTFQTYISTCQHRAETIASDTTTTSQREQQTQWTRAQCFANVRSDLVSRLAALLDGDREERGTAKGVVTDYCLWG